MLSTVQYTFLLDSTCNVHVRSLERNSFTIESYPIPIKVPVSGTCIKFKIHLWDFSLVRKIRNYYSEEMFENPFGTETEIRNSFCVEIRDNHDATTTHCTYEYSLSQKEHLYRTFQDSFDSLHSP